MKLRCLMAWQTYRKGDVIEPRSRMHYQALLAMRWAGRPYWEAVPEEAAATVPQPEPSRRTGRVSRTK